MELAAPNVVGCERGEGLAPKGWLLLAPNGPPKNLGRGAGKVEPGAWEEPEVDARVGAHGVEERERVALKHRGEEKA